MPVIGTAGHVDHGKSTLIHALTGIDPDRLREEKERGLTIDLGFAWLTLPSGLEVGVVDVPGHERFIKNMLAGAGGIDLALLVVAADEGPRPQTAEHLAILDLLEVPGGIVVLTKCDLVDDDYADLVEAELEDTLAGSRLAGAPVVRVSAQTGDGLDGLRVAIDDALATTPPKRDLGRPRLPIDRAFTIQGFGAVVTGTLVDGSLAVGDEMELFPVGLKCRVRGIQRHRTKVDQLGPGTRAAVNLSGVRAEDIHRGMVLARPGALNAVTSLVARLTASRIVINPLTHDAEVTLLSATSESQAKVRLLDTTALGRGEQCWAQFALDTPVAILARDHIIVRTPNETIAGGPVVVVNGRRLRRDHSATLEALTQLLAGTPEERVIEMLGAGPLTLGGIAGSLQTGEASVHRVWQTLVESGAAIDLGVRLASSSWIEARQRSLQSATSDYLSANPLRRAAPREHVRRALQIDPGDFELLVRRLVDAFRIELRGSGIAPPDYEPVLSARQQAEVTEFLDGLRSNPYSPPTERLPSPALLAYLVDRGEIEDTGAGVVFAADAFQAMLNGVKEHFKSHESISLAEVRDLFGTSRKYAQAFLEHLDALHITRRSGDSRTLR